MDAEVMICCACICTFFSLVFALIVGCIIAALVIPPQKITILDANLTRFELTTSPSTSLSYNLSFTMSIHNSAWHGKADYNDMEIANYYSTEQFDSIDLGNFGLKSTRIVNYSRSGSSTMNLTSNEVDAFKRSNETGYFDLEIWLRGKRIFEDDHGDIDKVHLSYLCKLRLQLVNSQNSTTQGNFKPVKCH